MPEVRRGAGCRALLMELTKKALEDVRFRTKGKWYSAEQVDAFLEELTVTVDGAERELEELRGETRGLERDLKEAREENARLEQSLQAAQQESKAFQQEAQALREQSAAPAAKPEPDSAAHQRRVCEELERERDELIADIKALRSFRETFRKAVEQDAASLAQQAKGLGSDKLL